MNSFALPQTGTYPSFYHTYISKLSEAQYQDLILSQVAEIRALFGSKEESWATSPYAPGKWSPKEVLGHIIDTDRIMTFRALCFSRGEQSALPGFDQDPYVINAGFNQVETGLLLADFEAERKALATLMSTLDESILDNVGTANGNPISPRSLLWIIPGHFIHHLNILKERY
ncbi:DinB family protein [Algoriphagus sp. H41]|uniref:DinB family protein n=1 Tax=Algoriphagus oliviformis TaxID=2811231 RepID=A0ABS3C0R6_9BACT|nr:DinB family protein [Algoriphagus oliviformis]MBN7810712.1 DinB family protein [Algoriphagus oliviformis]